MKMEIREIDYDQVQRSGIKKARLCKSLLLVEWEFTKNCRKNGKRNHFEERIFTRFRICERRKLK